MKVLKPGDTAVDCTAGNGNDTDFLCEIVKDKGRVYAFDIQEKALLSTKRKLEASGNIKIVKLIKDGHENLDKYIRENIKAAVFNLGYLPGESHIITTKSETTLEAVKKLLKLLYRNGVIIINIYHGHEEGRVEKEALYKLCSKLNQRKYNVFKAQFINQVNCPPELLVIERRV